MKIVMDKRIPGLWEGLYRLFPENMEITELEGNEIKRTDVIDADALFVRTRTHCDETLLQGSKVKFIGTATIGTEHIDIVWCEKNGIKVVNAPGCNAPAVMQYVASCLNLAGFDPSRHTLGIIGKGNIGSLVVRLYREAGVTVIVNDPPRQAAGFKDENYVSLDELLIKSDAITLHVPYTLEPPYPTHRLISNPLPENVKILVNASRGNVINPDLITPDKKFIIDTWPFEDSETAGNTPDRERLINSAFIATPHIAGYSIEGKQRATDAILKSFAQFNGLNYNDRKIQSSVNGLRYRLSDVIDSFDPLVLSSALKSRPRDFEKQRGSHLRNEPRHL